MHRMNPIEQRRAIDAQLVRRLDRIAAAAFNLSAVAFDNRFASGRGFADFTAFDRVLARRSALNSRAMSYADRAYRASSQQVAA
jgi:hypothetical protein